MSNKLISQKWYVSQDDLVGGHAITNREAEYLSTILNKTQQAGIRNSDVVVATMLSRELAAYLCDLHNRSIPGPLKRTRENENRPNWEIVPCAHCEVGVGVYCINPNGTAYQFVHKARRVAYLRLTQENQEPDND